MFIKAFKRIFVIGFIAGVIFIAAFFLLNFLYPLPLKVNESQFARVVTAEDGTPLRAFADHDGVWRYPITLANVSPLYIEALLNYEDRWFWYHPGVNPIALMRASVQNIRNDRVISGGSTLTMQVARLLDPHKKTVSGKLKQIFRAFQLEYHLSKEEILNLYLNLAPYGGPLEGVQAASYAYLGKSVKEVSHAEAALLAVLPQSPTRFRPDLHPDKAVKARDKVLKRLRDLNVWNETIYQDARLETVIPRFNPQPMLAPLLARRLKSNATSDQALQTTIDAALQAALEDLIHNYVTQMPAGTSAAILVVKNDNLAVKAYVGSADFFDEQRFGHVDMIKAIRSPGSTLKPFLYGLAIDNGLIHSASLLVDAPRVFGDYHPNNFSNGFSGPVSMTDALQRSLNIPATQVLSHLGPKRFAAGLKNAGLILHLPQGAEPNLAIILGGVGAQLEGLVGAYTAFARHGVAGQLRFTHDEPLYERRLLSEGSSWIIRKILQETPRPDRPQSHVVAVHGPKLAWKTGTSYGYRDAWSIGVTSEYTIGVWVGRPDGTALPGHYGRVTAAPLLFLIVDNLPHEYAVKASQPDNVKQVSVCWPLGTELSNADKSLCHRKQLAWVLDDNIPPTLSNPDEQDWLSNPVKLLINSQTRKIVAASCKASETEIIEVALWPKTLEPWLPKQWRRQQLIPDYDQSCISPPKLSTGALKITSIAVGTIIRPAPGKTKRLPSVSLQAIGGHGKRFWFINGKLEYEGSSNQVIPHAFNLPGRYQIAVVDEQGNSDVVELNVQL